MNHKRELIRNHYRKRRKTGNFSENHQSIQPYSIRTRKHAYCKYIRALVRCSKTCWAKNLMHNRLNKPKKNWLRVSADVSVCLEIRGKWMWKLWAWHASIAATNIIPKFHSQDFRQFEKLLSFATHTQALLHSVDDRCIHHDQIDDWGLMIPKIVHLFFFLSMPWSDSVFETRK